MTTTARDIITLAMKEAGVLGVGQNLLSEDINDGFTLLQRMLAQWQKRRWLVPALIDIHALGNGLKSNKIGPGQYYNSPRPNAIKAGYMIQLNTGSNPVSLPLGPIFSYEDYAKLALKNLSSLPEGFFYDGAFPYGNVFIWPVPSSIYEIHLLVQCAIGFDTAVSAGAILTAGAAYTDGVYPVTPLTGGTGTGATADITVAGGLVTVVTPNNAGNGYVIDDTLSADAANIGGTGAGFTYQVTGLVGSLDSEFDMPPEYEEAIHYNLALRLGTMYQMPLDRSQVTLAKIALNTIRVSNTQIPRLSMPSGLVRGRAFNIFNSDGN